MNNADSTEDLFNDFPLVKELISGGEKNIFLDDKVCPYEVLYQKDLGKLQPCGWMDVPISRPGGNWYIATLDGKLLNVDWKTIPNPKPFRWWNYIVGYRPCVRISQRYQQIGETILELNDIAYIIRASLPDFLYQDWANITIYKKSANITWLEMARAGFCASG
jgi:hypothetical protein